MQQFTFDGNIFYVVNENLRMGRRFDSWIKQQPVFRNNLYYFATDSLDQQMTFFPGGEIGKDGKSYEEWTDRGEQDRGSVYDVDPMFVDVEKDNFCLRSGSPMSDLPVHRLNLTDVQMI